MKSVNDPQRIAEIQVSLVVVTAEAKVTDNYCRPIHLVVKSLIGIIVSCVGGGRKELSN